MDEQEKTTSFLNLAMSLAEKHNILIDTVMELHKNLKEFSKRNGRILSEEDEWKHTKLFLDSYFEVLKKGDK